MADGVKRNKKTEDGYSHPFAVDEPRSAFSVVSKGNFKPTTTHIVNDEAFQPQRNLDGVHGAERSNLVPNMTGRNQRISDNAVSMSSDIGQGGSCRRGNRSHDLIICGEPISVPNGNPTRTTDLTNNNTVAFLETPIVKPIRRVNIMNDAIGPGVVFDSRDSSSECREMPHPNSVHDNMNGNLRNRGGRRHEAATSFSQRSENMRYANRDSGHEHSNVSNSNYPSALSERHSNFAINHRLANDLELLSRPSWCDAKFALDQIVQVSRNLSDEHSNKVFAPMMCAISYIRGTGYILLQSHVTSLFAISMVVRAAIFYVSKIQFDKHIRYRPSPYAVQQDDLRRHDYAAYEFWLCNVPVMLQAIAVFC